jgi:hypothetical protein
MTLLSRKTSVLAERLFATAAIEIFLSMMPGGATIAALLKLAESSVASEKFNLFLPS